MTLPVLALGGAGLVSVASNAIPAQMAKMVGAALAGDWPTARAINCKYAALMKAHNCKYAALMKAHFSEPSPAPVKAVLALMGRIEERLRLPMVPVTAATRQKLEAMLGKLELLHAATIEAR